MNMNWLMKIIEIGVYKILVNKILEKNLCWEENNCWKRMFCLVEEIINRKICIG